VPAVVDHDRGGRGELDHPVMPEVDKKVIWISVNEDDTGFAIDLYLSALEQAMQL
jgi:hypothetical protein